MTLLFIINIDLLVFICKANIARTRLQYDGDDNLLLFFLSLSTAESSRLEKELMHQFNIVFAIRRAGNKIKRLLLQID
jgi:hypothetical protein